MSVLLEKNGTTTAEVTMINARGILLFVGGKEYYLSYDRYPWFRNAKVSDVLDVTMPDEESLRWDAIATPLFYVVNSLYQSMWILRSTA